MAHMNDIEEQKDALASFLVSLIPLILMLIVAWAVTG